MTPSNGRSFFMLDYILVMLGGALGTGARFWGPGFVAEKAGELFPVGTLVVNVTGSFAIGFFAAFTDPGRVASCVTADSSILHDRRVRRLHNIFIIQLTNARPCSGRRLVQGLPEHGAFICLLCRSGMAWTHSCSRTIAEIKQAMHLPEDAVLLRIFIGESDRYHHQPLYEAIVLKARELQLAGATMLRGPMGFGKSSHLHTAKILRLSMDLPIVIEIVDTEEKVNAFLPVLDEMMGGGLVTLERAKVIRYQNQGKR
jgi:PII-like signaling protein